MEKVIEIPREFLKNRKLVIIPREDYEEYLNLKKIIPIVKISPSEKKAIKEGKEEIKKGEYLTLKEFKNELED